jgi:hypothetical protein
MEASPFELPTREFDPKPEWETDPASELRDFNAMCHG